MDAYLLGAGFSRAIHRDMPLMSGLGEAVIKDLALDPAVLEPFEDNIEMWLSYLAQEQPWHTDIKNLKNRALFMEVSQSISNIILSSDPSASLHQPKATSIGWDTLLRLVHKWCTKRNSVISFNYDLLFETLLNGFVKALDKRHLYGVPLVSRRDTSGMVASSQSDQNRPTLYKLHGSTNWLYGGAQDPHSPIVLREPDTYGNSYDDLQPVIIPPTSSKSAFYNNAALRAQWRNAGMELSNADRLIVIGYSMPESDLQVKAMLSTSLKTDSEIVVVDPAPEVFERIRGYFPSHEVTHLRSLEDYIEQNCDQTFFWFPTASQSTTGSQNVEHFGRNGHYRSRRTNNPPSTVHTNATKEAGSYFANIWSSVTTSPRRGHEGLTRIFISKTEFDAQSDPWTNCSHEEVLDLCARYPEVYKNLSDYQSRRKTRVFGAAWASGWKLNFDDVAELADYLLGKCSRDDITEQFGPYYSVHPPRSRMIDELDDDVSMAEWLGKKVMAADPK